MYYWLSYTNHFVALCISVILSRLQYHNVKVMVLRGRQEWLLFKRSTMMLVASRGFCMRAAVITCSVMKAVSMQGMSFATLGRNAMYWRYIEMFIRTKIQHHLIL